MAGVNCQRSVPDAFLWRIDKLFRRQGTRWLLKRVMVADADAEGHATDISNY